MKLRALLLLFISLLSTSVLASFSGSYALPGTWVQGVNAPVPSLWNIAGAPNSVSLINWAPWFASENNMTHVAATAGTVTFNWTYALTGGSPANFPAGYFVNGVRTQLSVNGGPLAQNGSGVSFAVNAGDTFGFYNGLTSAGIDTLTFTISNFSAPELPSPQSVPTLGAREVFALSALFVATAGFAFRRYGNRR